MSIGDILQDIFVELLNATWLSIITFTSYNCFSLFMAVLADCYSSSTAAGKLFAMCFPSSLPADAACGPAERREHLPQSKMNPLETFPRCRCPLAAHPIPPAPTHLFLEFLGPGTIHLAALSERGQQFLANTRARNRAGITVLFQALQCDGS